MPIFDIQPVAAFLREISTSIKAQASAAIAFTGALILIWLKHDSFTVILSLIGLFAICMLLGSLIEKYTVWKKETKEQQARTLQQKAGFLEKHEYTYKKSDPFPDPKFEGVGWIIALDQRVPCGYLTEPVCIKCKSNLIMKINKTSTGITLDCIKCKVEHEVDDVGQARALADAVFQGELRNRPKEYYVDWRI